MKSDIYIDLLKDPSVIKCEGELDYQCKTSDNKFSVGLYFNCHGLCDLDNKLTVSRIILTIYPGISAELQNCNDFHNYQIIMVYSQDPLRAYTYRLSIDSDSETAFIKVEHLPECDYQFISKQEIDGLSRSVLPSHKTFSRN